MSISASLDAVEGDLLGASTHHGDRVAVLSAVMGAHLGMSDGELVGLTTCALLHDNALTEYILAEREGQEIDQNMRLHCLYGQRNVDTLPLSCDIDGYVLYHHERGDGQGPFGKTEREIPLGAQIIGIADRLDVRYHLQTLSRDDLAAFKEHVIGRARNHYTEQSVGALRHVLTEEMLEWLRDEHICGTVARVLPEWEIDMEEDGIVRLAELIGRIIDYKSLYTRKHTIQIANRVWKMGEYYNLDRETRAQMYLAAALHDIGKLYIPTGILEKPGKLDDEEYKTIMEHSTHTYELLCDIRGFEDICQWASNHHEKLDGSGYPFGKTAAQLDFPSRLIACADIYQAVSEERPYHPRRSHEETMPVLYDMAEQNKIDPDIVADMDLVMAPYSGRDIPDIHDQHEQAGQRTS